jgi:hypothetical protein
MGVKCKSGKGRQAVYDAIQLARAAGSAWVTFRGARLNIVPLAERPKPGVAVDALVRSTRNPGGVTRATIWWHEGRLHIITNGTTRLANDDEVLALIQSEHRRISAGIADPVLADEHRRG